MQQAEGASLELHAAGSTAEAFSMWEYFRALHSIEQGACAGALIHQPANQAQIQCRSHDLAHLSVQADMLHWLRPAAALAEPDLQHAGAIRLSRSSLPDQDVCYAGALQTVQRLIK